MAYAVTSLLGCVIAATITGTFSQTRRLTINADFSTVTVLPEARAELICRFDGPYKDELIEWRKNDKALWRQSIKDREGNFLNGNNAAYDMSKQILEGELEMKLTVKRVTAAELGTFICKFITTEDTAEVKINLFTYACGVPREVSLGKNSSLSCEVFGNEKQSSYPSVDWIGDSTPPRARKAVLYFNASMSLMGKRETCQIGATGMKNVSCTSTYKIKEPYTHHGITSLPMRDGHGYLMQNVDVVQLQCNIEGDVDVEPKFLWTINGQQIPRSSRVLELNTTAFKDQQGNQMTKFDVACSGVGVNDLVIPSHGVYSFKLRLRQTTVRPGPTGSAALPKASTVFALLSFVVFYYIAH